MHVGKTGRIFAVSMWEEVTLFPSSPCDSRLCFELTEQGAEHKSTLCEQREQAALSRAAREQLAKRPFQATSQACRAARGFKSRAPNDSLRREIESSGRTLQSCARFGRRKTAACARTPAPLHAVGAAKCWGRTRRRTPYPTRRRRRESGQTTNYTYTPWSTSSFAPPWYAW